MRSIDWTGWGVALFAATGWLLAGIMMAETIWGCV